MPNRKAFTLIELLVVVLIIAVLAAVALPNYRVSVEKSKSAQLLTLIKSAASAQEAYYLANDEYADNLPSLPIDLPEGTYSSSSVCGISAPTSTAVKHFKDFEIAISQAAGITNVLGIRKDGMFKCGAFMYSLEHPSLAKGLYCMELGNASAAVKGSYCAKMGFPDNVFTSPWDDRFYQ
ncbi:prepilin-type N-terminal cleavage/methylation domain-containing protein [Parelusimicrobium proximum]|uniref:type IV pilin protein n=1 Tax=Parelusimicrobium proximum TaxID=3228953 RepID=UPI003D16F1BB